jgi:hypothetical protein
VDLPIFRSRQALWSRHGRRVEHVITTLAQDAGVLHTQHGDRLVVLYGRGVAAIEVAPRGAVV